MKTTSRASNSHVVASALAVVLSAGTLPAATIDTTGGTTVMVNTPEDRFVGNGTLQVSSTVWLDEDSSRTATEFAMTGGLITIDGGATLVNGGWQKGVWTENLAGMHVDGVFDIWDGNPVRIDALTGSGSVVKAHGGNSPTLLTVGVNHGGGVFSGTIANASGQIALTKVGAGTQILTGANTYTGATTVDNGTLQVGGQPYFDVGRTTTVASGAVFELFNSNNDFTTLMPISSITGSGTFRLSGNSTINQVDNGSVGTRLTLAMQAGGVIDLQDTSRLTNGGWQELDWTGNMASMNIATGATLDIWDGTPIKIDALTGSGTVDKVHGGNSPSSLILGVANGGGTFGGTIKNTGGQVALTKQGSGTQTLSGSNSYTGVTTISAGTLVAGNNTALGAGGFDGATMTFIQDGATLALQGGVTLDEHFHVWGAGIGGLGAVRSISGHNALTSSNLGGAGYALRSDSTIGVDADSLTVTGFYGELGGGFGLSKVGAGTLIFSTASTYSGNTTVENGTLLVEGAYTGGGLITVSSGATLGGSGTVGNVEIADGGTLAPGNSAGHLTVNALTLNPSSILNIELGAPTLVQDPGSDFLTMNDFLIFDGTINITALPGFGSPAAGDSWLIMTVAGGIQKNSLVIGSTPALAGGLTFAIDDSSDTDVFLTVVPEAGTAGLVGLGLLFLRRMKRKRHPADHS